MRFLTQLRTLVLAAVLAVTAIGLVPGSGSMAATPDGGAISAKFRAVGGGTGPLGRVVGPLVCGKAQGGCGQEFYYGYIYWSPATGAQVIRGAISGRWKAMGWERGALGYPTMDERCGLVSAGCYQKFQGGMIYWQSSVGANAVRGAIGAKWAQMGWELSPLGYPRGPEVCTGTTLRSCTQWFVAGTITWWATGKVQVNPSTSGIGVAVNKRRPLAPANYVPPDLAWVGSQLMRREAANQLAQLINAASAAGVGMTTVSGYRSYDTQVSLYNYYVSVYGQAYADTISARPGFSEHQTGLAMDIGNPNGACGLQDCFAATPAGYFAAVNAWRYGFIIRYPNGYSWMTGYTYEPWHLRYIGLRAAKAMHDGGIRTLEQFYGLPAAPTY